MGRRGQISRAARARLLREAAEACFFTGVDDLAERLSAANMRYGIAKLRHVQRALGIAPDASFVGAPDATITRNIDRWTAGFGYGGRLRWSGRFAVPDLKSNCCGLYLGRLPALPPAPELLERVRAVQSGGGWQGGDGDVWDFGVSNHFISVVALEAPVDGDGFAVLCHGSGPELREAGPHGPGLYRNRSPRLQEMSERFDTPWGPLWVIRDPDALAEYWQGYRNAECISQERRARLAQAVFPEVTSVSNPTHQGATDVNDCHLGCVVETGDAVVPVALRAELPVYLLRLRPNLTPAALAALGFAERAATTGLEAVLGRANVLPHGGGYTVPGYRALARVIEAADGARIFEMQVADPDGPRAFHTNFRHVPFGYRGEEVLDRVEALGMGEVVTRGFPRYEFMV